jgi:hypothetical protein
MKKTIRLTERDLQRIVKQVINEIDSSSCLLSAGFYRDAIGGPMTLRIILQKQKDNVTYQIGLDNNNKPTAEVTVIKRGGDAQSCLWSCDSTSPIGIKLSDCKKKIIELY